MSLTAKPGQPAVYDLPIYRGDTVTLQFTIEVDAAPPTDWDDWTFAAQVRASSESDEVVAEFDISTPEAGTLAISLPASVTAELPVRVLRWDLQRTVEVVDEEDSVFTYVRGAVPVTGDMTRDEVSS